MYHRIRIAVASLVVVIVSMLCSASTLSYFTDSDAKINNFAVGNISTTLAIYDDVTNDPWHEFDETDYATLLPGVEYDIPFYLQATNDGNVTVYQRFRVVIPSALASLIELDLPEDMNSCDVKTETCSNEEYTITYDDSVTVDGDEPTTYAEYYIVSKAQFAENEATSEWPIKGIKISIPEEGDYATLFTCTNNDRNNCVLGINVYSDAIQTTGFVNAEAAFANVGETY